MLIENSNNYDKLQNVIWYENILEALNNLADIEYQKLAWAGKHPQHYISSFTEVLARLYDDLEFESFIEEFKFKNGDNEVYHNIIELNNMINLYKDYGYKTEKLVNGYLLILNDTKWINITNKSRDIYLHITTP